MKRIYTKIGDVFSVKIDSKSKKYFQLIAYDLTQLNSDVIRAFKEIYPIQATPEMEKVVNGKVDFYAHCVTKWGVKMGYWEKVGFVKDVGSTNHILFRDSEDYGKPGIRVSNKWWVWSINGEQKFVGKLIGKYQKAEVGIIMDAESIIHRMKKGFYDGFYPDYE